jgi:hypothetical protein
MVGLELPLNSNIVNGVANCCFIIVVAPLLSKLLEAAHNKSDTSELLLTGRLALGRGVTICRKRVDLARSWRKVALLLAVLGFLAVELVLGFVFTGFTATTIASVQGIASVPLKLGNFTSDETQRPCILYRDGQYEVSLPILRQNNTQECESRPLLRFPWTKDQNAMTPVGTRTANGSVQVTVRWYPSPLDLKDHQFIYGEAVDDPDRYQIFCYYSSSLKIGTCTCMYKRGAFLYIDYSTPSGFSTFPKPKNLLMSTSRLKIVSEYVENIVAYYKGIAFTFKSGEGGTLQLLIGTYAALAISQIFVPGSGEDLRDNVESFVNAFFRFGERQVWTKKRKQMTRVSSGWGIAAISCFIFSTSIILIVLMCSRQGCRYIKDVAQDDSAKMMSLATNILKYGQVDNDELVKMKLVITSSGDENHLSVEPKETASENCRVETSRPLKGFKSRGNHSKSRY